jgi:hypothetical protein
MTLQEQTIMRAANPVIPVPAAVVDDRPEHPCQFRRVEK